MTIVLIAIALYLLATGWLVIAAQRVTPTRVTADVALYLTAQREFLVHAVAQAHTHGVAVPVGQVQSGSAWQHTGINHR